MRIGIPRHVSGNPFGCVSTATLEVARVADELVVAVAGRRRKIALPTGFAKLEVERVAIRDDELLISFADPDGVDGCDPVRRRPASFAAASGGGGVA